jgi:hypothetical protein
MTRPYLMTEVTNRVGGEERRDDGVRLHRQRLPAGRLADSAGVSYESAGYAGRYLRHYNYLLYVQTPSTATDKEDATFHAQ